MNIVLKLVLVVLDLLRDGFKLGCVLILEVGLGLDECVKLLLDLAGMCLKFGINFGFQHRIKL